MRKLLRKLLTAYDASRTSAREARMLPDDSWRRILSTHGIAISDATLERNGELTLPRIGITMDREGLPTGLLQSYSLATELGSEVGATFSHEAEGTVVAIRGVRHAIETGEDLFILKEIYRHGAYDCTVDTPVVVVDVGANVGFSSLFFARQFRDVVVEGFEPVGATYRRALRNVALNPELAPRITLHNYGLAPEDSQGQMLFDKERPGNATLIKDNCFTASIAEQIPVSLRKASTVIQEIRDRHPERRMLLKLDCEGSEYQILDELDRGGTLKEVDGILAEWHRVSNAADCNWICEVLGRNGFFVCASDRFSATATVGMLHAFRGASLHR
jgi:FkbM family methyltransferase